MDDWERFLAQAERLWALANGREEDYRTAVSRAYYACHLVARDRLFGIDAVNWGTSGWRPSHGQVIAAVRRAAPLDSASIKLEQLKAMREKADYIFNPAHPEVQALFANHNVRDWAGLADEALAIARDLLPRLRQLPPA